MRNPTPYIFVLILILLNLAVFHPLLGFGFANDYEYITQNPHVYTGLSTENIEWAFSSIFSRHWHPLTWMTHMADSHIFGSNAAGHHLTSLGLHILNTVLLFFILFLPTKKSWPSFIIAMLFAIHPLHVETVAWISDRKDVLSSFFGLLAILSYCFYVAAPSLWRFVVVFVLFIAGLMSKPMLLTLPLVLLIMDYWPLRRTGSAGSGIVGSAPRCSVAFLLVEKALLVSVSLLFGLIAVFAMGNGSMPASPRLLPTVNDLSYAAYSYIAYIGRMFFPIHLALPYPIPVETPIISAIICVAAIFLATAVAVGFRKKYPYLFTGWMIYMVTLLPVIGFFRVGPHKMTDRYTYIPLIGLFIIFAWGLESLSTKGTLIKRLKVPLTVALSGVLATLSWYQVYHWENDLTLFQHAAAVTSNNHFAYANLGYYYSRNDDVEKAIESYQNAIQAVPRYAITHNNLGLLYMGRGDMEKALAHLEKAAILKPDYADAFINIGVLKMRTGKLEEGIQNFQHAIQIDPQSGIAHSNLGTAMMQKNRLEDAAKHYQKAVALDPENEAFRRNLSRLNKKTGESGNPPDSPR